MTWLVLYAVGLEHGLDRASNQAVSLATRGLVLNTGGSHPSG